MAKTDNYTMRLDPGLKEQAMALYRDLGLSLTDAITVFLKQSVRENRLPFTPSADNPPVRPFVDLDEELLF